MPIIDYGALQEFPTRAGITGKWLSGHEQGATALSVLSNTAAASVAVPRHSHRFWPRLNCARPKAYAPMPKHWTADPRQRSQ